MAEGRILVVDDEETARLTLSQILRLEGYAVRSVDGGEAALAALIEHDYDLMILDLNMPGMGGMEVLKRVVQGYPQVRVVVLTAYGSMDTAIEALRNHAHDYLLKPALPRQIIEVTARVLEEPPRSAASLDEAQILTGGPHGRARFVELPSSAILDWNRRMITWKDRMILLTPTELRVLEILVQSPGQVVSHEDIIFGVQGYELDTEEAASILRPVMSRLRQKLSVIPGGKDWILTTRGTGYVFDEKAAEDVE
jgi:DNA-binding response OmpR family regulator